MSDGRARLACLVLTATVLAALALITQSITFGDGLGYDGQQYATMVRDLRTGLRDPVSSLAAYRLLAPVLVALTGLDVRVGFLILDAIATVVAAQAILAILRQSGAAASQALLGVFWWLLVPFGARAYLHYPVLTEALSLALTALLALAALRRATPAFAVLLALAVIARENLMIMLPFLFIALASGGTRGALWRTALAALPASIVLILVRGFAPVPADPVIALPGAALLNAFVFLLNVDQHAWRTLLALLFTFGALPAVAVALLPRIVLNLRREPAWAYLAAATVITTVLGGIDHDRYAAPLALPLVALVFGGPTAFVRRGAAALTALHGALAILPFPGGGDDSSYLARAFSTMDHTRLAPIAGLLLAGALVAWLVTRAGRALPGAR